MVRGAGRGERGGGARERARVRRLAPAVARREGRGRAAQHPAARARGEHGDAAGPGGRALGAAGTAARHVDGHGAAEAQGQGGRRAGRFVGHQRQEEEEARDRRGAGRRQAPPPAGEGELGGQPVDVLQVAPPAAPPAQIGVHEVRARRSRGAVPSRIDRARHAGGLWAGDCDVLRVDSGGWRCRGVVVARVVAALLSSPAYPPARSSSICSSWWRPW